MHRQAGECILFSRADAGDELSFCEEAGVTRPSSVIGGMLYVVDVDIVYGPLLRVEFESELLFQRFYEHWPPGVELGVAGVLADCDLRGVFEDEIEVAGEAVWSSTGRFRLPIPFIEPARNFARLFVILWVQQVNVVSHSPPRSIPKRRGWSFGSPR
jgi:hypothetical protein